LCIRKKQKNIRPFNVKKTTNAMGSRWAAVEELIPFSFVDHPHVIKTNNYKLNMKKALLVRFCENDVK